MREVILSKLKRVRQRLRIVSLAQAASRGLLTGACMAAGLAALRLSSIGNFSVLGGVIALIGVPLLAVIVAGINCLLKRDWLPAARVVDRQYQLKDRTETALSFLNRQQSGIGGQCEELQLEDAAQHLQQVEPQLVVPMRMPSSSRWTAAALAVAVGLLCWPTDRQQVSAGPAEVIPEIVVEAQQVADDLQELLEKLPESHDPEIDALVEKLQAEAEALQEPGVDVREALAKLSEMQSELQAVAAQFNVAQTNEQLQGIGEALQSAQDLAPAGKALHAGEYDKAADELSKVDNPQLNRQESRAVSDKLKKASAGADQKGLKSLSQAAQELAEGIENDKPSQAKIGAAKLGECAKQQSNRTKVNDLLKKQSDKLGECKSRCQANGQSGGNKLAKNPSLQAGKGTNSQSKGDRTDLASKTNRENIQGQKGEQGAADVETISSPESDEKAQRGLKEVYHKYRKLSETVLDQENLPLGHRQTIRRYFEAIRPRAEDAAE